jgi:hypothetical protein
MSDNSDIDSNNSDIDSNNSESDDYDNSEKYGINVVEYDAINIDVDSLKEFLINNSNLSKKEIKLVGKDKDFIRKHVDDVHEYIVENCESFKASPLHIYSLDEENDFIYLDAYYHGTSIECDSACLTFKNINGNYIYAEDGNYFVLYK